VDANKEAVTANKKVESLRQVGQEQRKQHATDRKTWKDKKAVLERANRDKLTSITRHRADIVKFRTHHELLKTQNSASEEQIEAAENTIGLRDTSIKQCYKLNWAIRMPCRGYSGKWRPWQAIGTEGSRRFEASR